MEKATLQTWLMLSNKPGRKSSSQIGGKCNVVMKWLNFSKQRVAPLTYLSYI